MGAFFEALDPDLAAQPQRPPEDMQKETNQQNPESNAATVSVASLFCLLLVQSANVQDLPDFSC